MRMSGMRIRWPVPNLSVNYDYWCSNLIKIRATYSTEQMQNQNQSRLGYKRANTATIIFRPNL